MPLVTFSSPEYKDKTVYAVAGSHTETLLKIAKGYHLTEKEKAVLRSIGKLSKDELERLIVDDMPSDWRLACQMIVRDEDILVEY